MSKKSVVSMKNGVRAYVLVETVPGRVEAIVRSLDKMSQVRMVDPVAGPFDIVIQLEVGAVKDFAHVVAGRIGGLKGVTRTTTLLCTS